MDNETKVEIYGDWSGGVSYQRESDWVNVNDIKPYDPKKVKTYDKKGLLIKNTDQ